MHFVSAMDSVKGIRAILGLHETVCTGAADGYGRMARRPAMSLLHLGPGLANGLCNLHNARRAGTPLVNLVGEMATWHKGADPLLNMDVEGIAVKVSKEVWTCRDGEDLYRAMATACLQAQAPQKAIGGSNICTLIVPHNLSWEKSPKKYDSRGFALEGGSGKEAAGSPEVDLFVQDCAKALSSMPDGKVALYIGGAAAIQDDDALLHVGKIASKLGAPIYCENAFGRLDRGAGLPRLTRLPYFPDDALNTLKAYGSILVVDARRPVANFGYENGPSHVMTLPDEDIWEIDSADVHVPTVLRKLSKALGAEDIVPSVNCRGKFCDRKVPSLPAGRLNAAKLCQTLAALQPKETILVDESLTSGNGYWDLSHGCAAFSHLALTGGAIGCGPPLAVGAAIACPDRQVINLQADGSCMYSLQALWTQARENLRVITIVCANRSYQILKVELAKQQISPSNGPCARALTDIGHPAIDWVAVGQGLGVPSHRAETVEQLASQLTEALSQREAGPFLIEACLA